MSRKAQLRIDRRRRELRRNLIIAAVVVVILIVAAIIGVLLVTRPVHHAVAGPPQPIDGIPCRPEITTYHEHAHLTILDGGAKVNVPGGIGIHYAYQCYYWLHTHDSTGIIHLEAPHPFNPTLGMFFDVWHQPLSPTRIAGVTVGKGQTLRSYVNGKRVTTNPRFIHLHPYTKVVLEVGPPFVAPPKYSFPPGY